MAGKIKVLGLNFGRVNGECKKYLNIALEEAKAAGAETEIIDTVTKKSIAVSGAESVPECWKAESSRSDAFKRMIMKQFPMQCWMRTVLS